MAASYVSVQFTDPVGGFTLTGGKREILQKLIAFSRAVLAGARSGSATVDVRSGLARASGTVTLSTASGTITATINGVAIQVTWATSDANTASLLAAAINASSNALVADLVTASAASNVVTITSVAGGKVGNCITLAASGTGATASGARLTGGSETRTSSTF